MKGGAAAAKSQYGLFFSSFSEATRHIPDDYKALAPEIPRRQIAAIGNLLRHEYQRADNSATWNIVAEHLPALAKAVDRLVGVANSREAP